MKFIVRLLFKIINYLWILKIGGLSVPQKKLFSNNFPLWHFDPEIFHLAEVLVEKAVEEGIGAGAAHAADVTGCVHQHTCLLLQPIRVLKNLRRPIESQLPAKGRPFVSVAVQCRYILKYSNMMHGNYCVKCSIQVLTCRDPAIFSSSHGK